MGTCNAGVDLHRNNFTYCVRTKDGEEAVGKYSIQKLRLFAGQFGKRVPVEVEATGNTWMFCEEI